MLFRHEVRQAMDKRAMSDDAFGRRLEGNPTNGLHGGNSEASMYVIFSIKIILHILLTPASSFVRLLHTTCCLSKLGSRIAWLSFRLLVRILPAADLDRNPTTLAFDYGSKSILYAPYQNTVGLLLVVCDK